MPLIERFFVPNSEAQDVALSEINMPRLGRFVALAGKNGSGKSRVLNKLESYVNGRAAVLPQISQLQLSFKQTQSALRNDPNSPYAQHWSGSITSIQSQIHMAHDRVIASAEAPLFKPVRLVPKQLQLLDPRTLSSGQLISQANQAATLGVDAMANNCLAHVTKVQTQWWNTSHQNHVGSGDEKSAALASYKYLRDLIKVMLATTLERDNDGFALLFGKPIADTGLSDGQKIILQLCVTIHAQGGSLDSVVIILDELENHLHPSAAIDLLRRLYDASPNTQIWLATHSIPLLAYIASVEPMSIWFVNDGDVTNAGKNPQIVLESLLGDEARIGQLNNFTGLPAQLAAINFASECLLPPQVVASGTNDPQTQQIQTVMNSLKGNSALSVLDYGAGKGRLLQGLAAQLTASDMLVSEHLDYYAFDKYEKDKAACTKLVESVYSDQKPRYFHSEEDFYNHKDDGSISLVVMCNVLHEIPATEWLTLFGEHGLIHRSLSKAGFVLIVEDQRIPTGEKAHEYGFLVLDTAQLKTLFAITDADVQAKLFTFNDHRDDGRLKAHLIHQSLLKRVTTASRRAAIEQLQAAAKIKFSHLQTQTATYANGQQYGFWTQQFANASLVLDVL